MLDVIHGCAAARLLHPYNAWTVYVEFSPTRKDICFALLCFIPRAKCREVFRAGRIEGEGAGVEGEIEMAGV